MKRNTLILTGLAIVSVATFTSCSTNSNNPPMPPGMENVTAIETPDGAIIVDTFTVTATVTGIDEAKRKVTYVTSDGKKSTYTAGPEVVNFAQIQVGDQIKATLTEEAAVYIGKGAPPNMMAGAGVALAPVGAKPGGVMVDTEQVTAKITGIDTMKHKVTLQMPDGTTKTVKAGKKVDLSTLQIGDDVTVQVGESLAITVMKQ